MPLNHSFTITMCNTKLIMKLALLMLLLALIVSALLFAVLNPVFVHLKEIVNVTEVDATEFINHPILTIKSVFVDQFIAYFKTIDTGALITYVILLYILVRFFIFLPQLPVTKVLYSKMTTGYDVGLLNAFIAMGLQNLLLSFLLALVASVIEIGVYIGIATLCYLCVKGAVYILLPFLIILGLAAMSAKTCLYLQFFPEICASDAKNIFVGIRKSLKGTFMRFRKNFLCTFTLNVALLGVIAATVLPTFGAMLLLLIPAYTVFLSTLSLTLNFSFHGQKYFVNNGETVYTPTKLF